MAGGMARGLGACTDKAPGDPYLTDSLHTKRLPWVTEVNTPLQWFTGSLHPIRTQSPEDMGEYRVRSPSQAKVSCSIAASLCSV